MRLYSIAFALAAAAASVALAPAREEQPVVLRLADGSTEVSGSILDDGFDEATGITLRRDDNGGILELRWDQIWSDDVARIKRSRGYLGDDLQPVLVPALKVTTFTGDELLGVEEKRDATTLHLRRRDNVTPIPIKNIKRIAAVTVDALEVENPANVLERMKAGMDPAQAVEWYNLGLTAEALTLYEQAQSSFEKCLDLDATFSKRDLIDERVKGLAIKIKEREQTAELNRIVALKMHGEFDAALAASAKFVQTWPASQLRPLVEREIRDVSGRRLKSLSVKIRADFYAYLRSTAQTVARDREKKLGEAMTWAKDTAYKDVTDKLMALYSIGEKEVAELWEQRGLEGSPQVSSYGGGTFVLKDDAKKGYEKGKVDPTEAKPAPSAGGEKSLEEKIADKLKEAAAARAAANKKKVQKADTIADVPPTPEEWWAGAATEERAAFLMAFFAEHAGRVRVISLEQRRCVLCDGTGILQAVAVSSAQQQSEKDQGPPPCSRCKSLTFDRIVKYK